MNESKELLEATIKGLEEKVNQLNDDLMSKQRELADVNKPEMTDVMFDELSDLVHDACNELEINSDDMEYELGMDYDNRVEMQSVDFRDRDGIAEQVMNAIDTHYKTVATSLDKE